MKNTCDDRQQGIVDYWGTSDLQRLEEERVTIGLDKFWFEKHINS